MITNQRPSEAAKAAIDCCCPATTASMPGILPSVLVLSVIAIVALWLTISRGGVAAASSAAIQRAVWAAAIAVAAQAGHFVEELATGLHERLPAVFSLPPMPLRLFVSFNLACLGIWTLSTWGLARRRRRGPNRLIVTQPTQRSGCQARSRLPLILSHSAASH